MAAAKVAAQERTRKPDIEGAIQDSEKARRAIKQAQDLVESAMRKAHGGGCAGYHQLGAAAAAEERGTGCGRRGDADDVWELLGEARGLLAPWMGELRWNHED